MLSDRNILHLFDLVMDPCLASKRGSLLAMYNKQIQLSESKTKCNEPDDYDDSDDEGDCSLAKIHITSSILEDISMRIIIDDWVSQPYSRILMYDRATRLRYIASRAMCERRGVLFRPESFTSGV